MPWAAATAVPSSTSPVTSRRRPGFSHTRPCVSPVSAPTGLVAALKMSLRHWGPRASLTASVGRPAREHAAARRSTSSNGGGLGSKGPIVVSPFTSHWTWPGSMTRPAGKVVPRITRGTCSASASSLPIPFWTEQTEPSANAAAVAAIAGSVCIAFVATIPKSQAGTWPGSLVAGHCRPPRLLPRAAGRSR